MSFQMDCSIYKCSPPTKGWPNWPKRLMESTSWFPNTTQTLMPGRSELKGMLAAKVTRHDWLEAACASRFLPEALSSARSPAASPAAILWQEAGSIQACQCPVRVSGIPSNGTNCSLLTAAEQNKKKNNLSGCLSLICSLNQCPPLPNICHHFGGW